MFEQRQLWELERHNAFNVFARFIEKQPNLINNKNHCKP
jgi:hypothetical protein